MCLFSNIQSITVHTFVNYSSIVFNVLVYAKYFLCLAWSKMFEKHSFSMFAVVILVNVQYTVCAKDNLESPFKNEHD